MTTASAHAKEAQVSFAPLKACDACRICSAACGRVRGLEAPGGFADGFRAGITAADKVRAAEEVAADRKRDAWLEFEDRFLTGPGGGRVAAQIFDACERAFEQAWPDQVAAHAAAKTALLGFQPDR
ncbi:conserved hypothetical protein [Hyphomicrobiales bacterium]|nr:conserved hypothetical protein [Hyphomicrobiales bacterium]CAH1702275.1 hypothetical protein BOSEA1005_30147 [Hyphomicrobiales bacterium]CAI0346478.1 conserved hypothetical protein [Hyphomicrobiales bacterium]